MLCVRIAQSALTAPEKEKNMRKKTMAVLLAGAVAATGVLGLTACKKDGGGNGLEKGEKVSEEQWKAAITATVNAENYTVNYDCGYKTVGRYADGPTVTYTSTSTGKMYYDFNNKKLATEAAGEYSAEYSGGEREEETYSRKSYSEADGLSLWAAAVVSDEIGWEVYSTLFASEAELKAGIVVEGEANNSEVNHMFTIFTEMEFSTTETSESAPVSELYSAFTYKDGLYSAALLYNEEDDTGVTEISVALSIKNGFVVGFMWETSYERLEEDINCAYTGHYKYVYNFSNFGTTTVTAPDGAAEAIVAKKASADN